MDVEEPDWRTKRNIKTSEQSSSVEIVSPTWASIKPTDFPSRLESKLRIALAGVYMQFYFDNYYVRLKREYHFIADPDRKRLIELTNYIREEKEKLVTKARKALELAD